LIQNKSLKVDIEKTILTKITVLAFNILPRIPTDQSISEKLIIWKEVPS
jgi:hypothetical protein